MYKNLLSLFFCAAIFAVPAVSAELNKFEKSLLTKQDSTNADKSKMEAFEKSLADSMPTLLAVFFCFISAFAQNDPTTAPKPEYDVVVKTEPVEQPQTIDAGVEVAPRKGNWLLLTTCGIALWDAVTLMLMAGYEDDARNAFDEAKKDFVTEEEYK